MTPRTQFTRLLWKEYRHIRAFGLVLLGCGIALLFASLPTVPNLSILIYIALVISILFAVASSAIGFSAEHENGTFLFQRVLPTSLPNVAAAKFGVAVIGAIVIFSTLWAITLIGWYATGRRWISDTSPGYDFAEGLLTLTEFLVFGTLFSLIERRSLVALAKAVGLVFAVRGLGYCLDSIDVREIGNSADVPWPSVTLRLISLTLGIVFLFRSVVRWYADEPINLLPKFIAGLTQQGVVTLRRPDTVLCGEWRRLLWLQTRVSIWPIAIFIVIGIVAPISAYATGDWFIMAIALMLIGAIAFRAANHYRQALATIGASPRTIWWTQLCLPMIGGATILVTFVTMYAPHLRLNDGIHDIKYMIFTGLYSGLAATTWGQLASFRCKSAYTAFGYSAGLLIPASLWIACAVFSQAPFWLFVAPLIVYPLAESFLRIRRWFIEDRRVGIWWFARVGLYLSLALGLISYRYYEIPGVSQNDLNRALSIVPHMNEAQTARFRVLADALMDREAFEPVDVHNQIEIEQALKNNQYRWVADHRALVDEIIDGPYLTLQLQTEKPDSDVDRRRFGTINEFVLAVFETALHEGDVDLGESIIRKIPLQITPTGTLLWCRLPMNDSRRIRRLAHELQDASVFDRECRRVMLRQWLLPNLKETWGENYQSSLQYSYWWWETAALYIATDGIRWKRQARYFTVEAARQLEAILPGFPPGAFIANTRHPNRSKRPLPIPILRHELPTIYAHSVYSGVLGKLGGTSFQLALVSWQMDHDGRLPNSLNELTIEYMPKLRLDPSGGSDFVYEKNRLAVAEEVVRPDAKHYFAFVFGGGTSSIEVPFRVLSGTQKMRDSEGRLPPFVYSSHAPKVWGWHQDIAHWSYANVAGMIFPLDLPAEKPGSDESVNSPRGDVTSVK